MIDISKLSEDVTTPRLCQDKDDFYKFIMTTALTAKCQTGEAMVLGLRLLLHEYMALVLQGELPPYSLEEVPETFTKQFCEMIFNVTEYAIAQGVPTKEENGKMVLDEEAILRAAEEEDG